MSDSTEMFSLTIVEAILGLVVLVIIIGLVYSCTNSYFKRDNEYEKQAIKSFDVLIFNMESLTQDVSTQELDYRRVTLTFPQNEKFSIYAFNGDPKHTNILPGFLEKGCAGKSCVCLFKGEDIDESGVIKCRYFDEGIVFMSPDYLAQKPELQNYYKRVFLFENTFSTTAYVAITRKPGVITVYDSKSDIKTITAGEPDLHTKYKEDLPATPMQMAYTKALTVYSEEQANVQLQKINFYTTGSFCTYATQCGENGFNFEINSDPSRMGSTQSFVSAYPCLGSICSDNKACYLLFNNSFTDEFTHRSITPYQAICLNEKPFMLETNLEFSSSMDVARQRFQDFMTVPDATTLYTVKPIQANQGTPLTKEEIDQLLGTTTSTKTGNPSGKMYYQNTQGVSIVVDPSQPCGVMTKTDQTLTVGSLCAVNTHCRYYDDFSTLSVDYGLRTASFDIKGECFE